ncbi:hypothetical protein WR25_06444 [Diploscapter pachys]|uniref:Uncharacterized protein n=1 Tax=Diploscapter pachys TaxID=2018661 RepID=A0A2A2K9D8_9BILA|nr:hypothetical protein WR25_06444 [Diploscapter pachys]
MQLLLPILCFLGALLLADAVPFRIFFDENEAGAEISKRARSRELFGKRSDPTLILEKRARSRELFGKRASVRRSRELFGKRSSNPYLEEYDDTYDLPEVRMRRRAFNGEFLG